jgi:hypothetical protein
MCFSVPKEVKSVHGQTAILEDGSTARFGTGTRVQKGQFVEVTGSIVVSVLSKTAGNSIRKLIKQSSV